MNHIYKLIIIGDSGVGKSNIMFRYTTGAFDHDSISTIGVEFITKTLKVDNKEMKLQIWDCAGQEKYRSISRTIYHGTKGIFLVYDITKADSFDHLEEWINEINTIIDPEKLAKIPVILIGNKSDLEHIRAVPKIKADAFARAHNMSFFETSALLGDNITKVFQYVAEKILENNDSDTDTLNYINLYKNSINYLYTNSHNF